MSDGVPPPKVMPELEARLIAGGVTPTAAAALADQARKWAQSLGPVFQQDKQIK